MKLTGILKDKVDKAETMDEKKDIIAQAGMELTDEELDGVAGGGKTSNPICKNCQKPFFTNAMMGEVFCPDCRSKMM